MSTSNGRFEMPPGPEHVPPSLTAPSSAFKRHAALSGVAFVAFIVVYLGLIAWLCRIIYRFMRDGFGANPLIAVLQSLIPSLLLFVLVRGLFVIKRGRQLEGTIQVRPEEEPTLFEFLYDVADKVRAPRPHRVFLSHDVNAAVIYDLGFVNFIFPTKKNLVIGLGLLNVLTMSELRAVLAHEFGHFAQRATAWGRWVYLAEQIANYIATSRSKLDNALQTLSYQDPRIAWIGWALRLCVWSVRAVLDTMYLLVALSKRALSREMEFQADLVAVSVTGSDALVHALYKSPPAEAALSTAIGQVRTQLAADKLVTDLYALQSRVIDNLRRVNDDPRFASAPPLPLEDRAKHRVFEDALAQPSQMWSTHPASRDREDNAKAVYVPCALDDRSAWAVIADPERTRNQVTALVVDLILNPPPAPGQPAPEQKRPVPATKLSVDEANALLDASFDRSFNRPEYRGTYRSRPLTRAVASSDALFEASAGQAYNEQEFPPMTALYPVAMREEIERWQTLQREVAMLEGLHRGTLQQKQAAPYYRGEPLVRRELPKLIERATAERDAAAATVAARDRHLRTLHQQLARRVGKGWDAYHESLVRLAHYAEHTAADIADAYGFMNNVYVVVTADGHVSSAERRRLTDAAHVAYRALREAYEHAAQVNLPPNVLEKMNRSTLYKEQVVQSWAQRLGELKLNSPDEFTLGDWLVHAGSWLSTVPADFEALADAAVEELLEVEELLRGPVLSSKSWNEIVEAPAPASVPAKYNALPFGAERPRQRELGWWERFQLADGVAPATARAIVAASMLFGMGYVSHLARSHVLYVYNGLGVAVVVEVSGGRHSIEPGTHTKFDIPTDEQIPVRATTTDGVAIERFDADASNGQNTYVYNVARAAALYHFTATYGDGAEEANRAARPRFIGNPRWISDDSSGRFTDYPQRVSLARGQRSTTRTLLGAPPNDANPMSIVPYLPEREGRALWIAAHLRFDPINAEFGSWATLAMRHAPETLSILRERIEREPQNAVALMRVEQDASDDEHREGVCVRHRVWASAHPGAGSAYILARCERDATQRTIAFTRAFSQYPQDPYLSVAVAYEEAERLQWDQAMRHLGPGLEDARTKDMAMLLATRVTRTRWALEQQRSSNVYPRLDAAPISDYYARSQRVRDWIQSERGAATTGDREPGPLALLAVGRIDDAVASARSEQARASIVQLAGASDGAAQSQVRGALAYAESEQASPLLSALLVREGRPVPERLARQLQRVCEPRTLLSWLEGLHRSTPEARAALTLAQVPATCGAPFSLVLATIVLGPTAPAEWRLIARAYYFTGERPYFSEQGVARVQENSEAFGFGGLGLSGSASP